MTRRPAHPAWMVEEARQHRAQRRRQRLRRAVRAVAIALLKRGTHPEVNAHCKGHIEPGERYREGEMDPYYAGGFGKERVCLGCDKAGLA